MKLNKNQIEALDNLIEQVQALHEEWEELGEEGFYGDTKEGIIDYAEEFVYELGKIDKKLR